MSNSSSARTCWRRSECIGRAAVPFAIQLGIHTAYTLARTLTEKGLNTWFLVTVDYVFGHSFSTDVRKGVKDAGGTVLGEVRHPLNTSDFSSFLLQAQSSGAKVIALLSAGGDML